MNPGIKKIRFYFAVLAVLWVLLVIINFYAEYSDWKNSIIEVAKSEAHSAYLKDSLYRRWNAKHGGVYVVQSDYGKPNPYLQHVKNRDIETVDGKKLTLINPAYMTRQVFEMAKKENVVQGHLTSSKLLNPINKPDEWEKEALEEVESGVTNEYSSVAMIEGKPFLRFMRPFITEEGCMKCHAIQGYRVGDIRGGISVEIPLSGLLYSFSEKTTNSLVTKVAVLLFGLTILGGAYIKMSRMFLSESKLKNEREVLLKELNHRVKNNLQMIISMVDLQRMNLTSEEAAEIMEEFQGRLSAMATMHNMLDIEKSSSSIQTGEYFEKIAKYYESSYRFTESKDVRLHTDIGNFEMGITQAVSCGLIINELITNAFKHAFKPGVASPEVSVTLKKEKNQAVLIVRDNGVGFDDLSFKDSDSYGILMIESLTDKLNGSIHFNGEEGSCAKLRFPL